MRRQSWPGRVTLPADEFRITEGRCGAWLSSEGAIGFPALVFGKRTQGGSRVSKLRQQPLLALPGWSAPLKWQIVGVRK